MKALEHLPCPLCGRAAYLGDVYCPLCTQRILANDARTKAARMAWEGRWRKLFPAIRLRRRIIWQHLEPYVYCAQGRALVGCVQRDISAGLPIGAVAFEWEITEDAVAEAVRWWDWYITQPVGWPIARRRMTA